MADTGLREILDEIVDVLDNGLSGSNPTIQVERGFVLNPSPPVIDVHVTDPARDINVGGFGDIGAYQITVRARVLTADNDAGQDLLISFMDDTDDLCIPLFLLDEPTLNGKAASLDLVAVSGHRAYERADGGADLGCQWDFVVTPARS